MNFCYLLKKTGKKNYLDIWSKLSYIDFTLSYDFIPLYSIFCFISFVWKCGKTQSLMLLDSDIK